jgi:hypothetical protein
MQVAKDLLNFNDLLESYVHEQWFSYHSEYMI